jgi:23S rRNA (guanosine2251-2'-O)-methyltransferase
VGKPARPGPTHKGGRDHENAGPPAIPRKGGGHLVLFGAHAVRETLRARRRAVFGVFATAEAAERLAPDLAAAGLAARIVDAQDLARRLGPNAVHQGVMVEAGPLPRIDLEDITARTGIVLVLDQITDPHNVGAILRTACAFNVDAVIVTERHSPEFSGVLAKAASGALEFTTIVSVVNLARALDDLAERGYARVGLDSDGAESLSTIALSKPLALVLGAEGKGLRRLTRERCDAVARLDLPGPIKSLNVSNACAAALSVVTTRLG